MFVVDADDTTAGQYPGDVIVVPGGSLGKALRQVDQQILGDATSVGVIGDDCRFRTPGWDVAMDGWLTETVGIAWPFDGWDHPWPSETKASHWWLSRPIVDAMGLCPPSQHLWMDDYWAQLAHAAGCARYFADILVEHMHPMAGKSEQDATYRRHSRWIAEDRAWWHAWQRGGKRRDVARLRALLGKLTPVRVFADWHHPALWEALSIVFEDRFGWELYSPTGREWLRHGWRLRDATPGWSALDYLADPGDEPEYPRKRKLVTWDEFTSLDWDIVIASVGVHQRTFYQLARSRGATFVHHIGDAKRRHERGLRGAVIIASANRGADVVHHQEFDRALFAYSPAEDTHAVASLMLRLGSTSGPHEWMSGDPDVHWSAVECEAMRGPGYLAPMSAVAERMRAAGWIWHDKRIGDGYGHVLFTAAAMGRPLIGHASHYRGLLGERLWEDGVTCLSLDDKSPVAALREWRDISDDRDRYAAMSEAIRDRFDELVDFDAEADAIRAALEG